MPQIHWIKAKCIYAFNGAFTTAITLNNLTTD